MTDEEFNRYCAEVMGHSVHEYDDFTKTIYVIDGEYVVSKRYIDLNQMAEVFDKLWNRARTSKTMITRCLEFSPRGNIAHAMREFIESTGREEHY